MILKIHASVPVRKERLSPMSKARREASQNKLIRKIAMPDSQILKEVNRSKNRRKARPGFV